MLKNKYCSEINFNNDEVSSKNPYTSICVSKVMLFLGIEIINFINMMIMFIILKSMSWSASYYLGEQIQEGEWPVFEQDLEIDR
ncbi:17471_t:CDS:2 [Gigaspora rosea]|nr:17471_t:CDS:2 [Gigaspora rosea]